MALLFAPSWLVIIGEDTSGKAIVLLLTCCALCAGMVIAASMRNQNRPPGPLYKGASRLHTWKALALLHERYGPIVSFYQGKTLLTSLGTLKAATDLLDKQGTRYSGRPRNIMGCELMSGGMRGIGMPYGKRWRDWRSLMHAGLGSQASDEYKGIQSLETKILLHDLLTEEDRSRYGIHIRRTLASISMCIGYGRRVKSFDDPVVAAQMVSEHAFERYSEPGKYLVESWPILLKFPRFMQWFRHEPEAQQKRDAKVYMSLFNEAKRKIVNGEAPSFPFIMKKAMEKQEEIGMTDLEMAFALSAPYSAGVGTTYTTIEMFILAMLHHPHVKQEAQQEIDSVVGRHRLPEFEDAESLPYTRAVIKETMRWRPIFPLGVPHSVNTDDVYDGMHLPAGSTVLGNAYLISRDDALFPSPNEFKPERYLESDLNKAGASSEATHSTFVFGFGRRICPGMFVARNSLFIIISRLLWAFDILPLRDSNGNEITPSVNMEDFIEGLVVRPRPFDFYLKPRKGEESLSVIAEEYKKARVDAASWA